MDVVLQRDPIFKYLTPVYIRVCKGLVDREEDSIAQAAWRGAQRGALTGVTAGALTVFALVSGQIVSAICEGMFRSFGAEPSWPIVQEDCTLPQFKEIPLCQHSFSTLAGCIVGGTIACGVVIGTVHGLARKLLT